MFDSDIEELADEEFQLELHRLKQILGLRVEIILEVTPNKCEVYWDESHHCYKILYGFRKIDYGFLHELGHIRLAEIAGYRQFASFTISSGYALYPATEVIPDYINKLVDCFVNHQIFRAIETYYPIFLKVIDWILEQTIPDHDFHENLAMYLFWYIEFHYNLKAEDVRSRLPRLNAFLLQLGSRITMEFPIDFQQLHGELDQFQTIQTTHDAKEIRQFIYSILSSLSLWDSAIFREFFDHVLPLLPE